jgi:hypothetical protein
MMLFPPLVGFDIIPRDELNDCLIRWDHKMGPLNRPDYGQSVAHGLRHHGELVAVTATEGLITPQTCGLHRDEAFELARVCAVRPHLCRPVLRIWREFVFPAVAKAWDCSWAISYQDAVLHSGGLYRHDGWLRIGFTSSGTDPRSLGGPRRGRKKVVWAWTANEQLRTQVRAAADTRPAPRWAA